MPRLPRMLPAAALALLGPLGTGCSDGGEPAPEVEAAAPPAAARPRPAGPALPLTAGPLARSADPELAAARAALEAGDVARARALRAPLSSEELEVALLDARLALAGGDAVLALKRLEVARQRAPRDARVFATEAELYAVLGNLAAATEALKAGFAVAGACADLSRARGVVLLASPGGQEAGLAHLNRAREQDPSVPWIDAPTFQGELLVGRLEISREAPERALAHALRARALAPDDLDAVELEADARGALLQFEEALALFERLAAAGRDVGDTRALLHHRAATRALLASDRAVAVAHYRAARALGLDDEGLGFGASVLHEECDAAIERGVERYRAGAFDDARTAFDEALALEPASLEARSHLGAALFRLGDYAAAATTWQAVLDGAAARGIELDQPVHLDLARALRSGGDPEAARGVLQGYLRARKGPFGEETRALLEHLDAEQGAERQEAGAGQDPGAR